MNTSNGGPKGGGLRADALGTAGLVAMAIAGCGPAYTMVVTLPVLIAVNGLAAPATLLICAIPLLGIAFAFQHLGRLDVNAGATYSWVARSLHPFLGFLAGWAVVVSTTVFLVTAALPAGAATLGIFSSGLADDAVLSSLVGAGWFVLAAALVVSGSRLGGLAQVVLTGVQVLLLVAFVAVALLKSGGVNEFSLSWFGFGHFTGVRTFTAGALVAVFVYWGWDVTSNLSEETIGGGRRTGAAGPLAVVVVLLLFAAFVVAVNIHIGPQRISDSGAFADQLSQAVLPGVGGKVLVLGVLLSTVTTLQTTMLQATRTLFAMGRDRTLPSVFGRIHPRWRTPWIATVVVTVLGTLLVVASVSFGSAMDFVQDAVAGIGLHIAFYYGLAALAAVVAYRKTLTKSVSGLLLHGVWPLLGAGFMLWIFVESVRDMGTRPLLIGAGLLAAGLVPMLYAWFQGRSYFRPLPLEAEQAATAQTPVMADVTVPHRHDRRDGVLSDF